MRCLFPMRLPWCLDGPFFTRKKTWNHVLATEAKETNVPEVGYDANSEHSILTFVHVPRGMFRPSEPLVVLVGGGWAIKPYYSADFSPFPLRPFPNHALALCVVLPRRRSRRPCHTYHTALGRHEGEAFVGFHPRKVGVLRSSPRWCNHRSSRCAQAVPRERLDERAL